LFTILIADDAYAIAHALAACIALAWPGSRPVVAMNYEDVLHQIGQEQFAAVVIDAGIVSGYQGSRSRQTKSLLAEIEEKQKNAKVILMSGRTREEVNRMIPGADRFLFLPKPFAVKDLVQTLRLVIGDTAP
jgi:DNA-binding NtrC family response regulator